MIKNNRYNLVKIIYNDFRIYGKVQLILLLLIIISAILVIWVTHQTRCVINKYDNLLLKKYSLEYEWNSFLLEKEMLSNHIRIEEFAASKLHMHYANSVSSDIWSY